MRVNEARAAASRWLQTVQRLLDTGEEVGFRRYLELTDQLRRLSDYTGARVKERVRTESDKDFDEEMALADIVADVRRGSDLLALLHARVSIEEMEAARAEGIDLEDILSPATDDEENEA